MSVDLETIRQTAQLAQLRYDDDALKALSSEFDKLLDFVSAVQEDFSETVSAKTNDDPRTRPDVVSPTNQIFDKILSQSSRKSGQSFRVPRVVES